MSLKRLTKNAASAGALLASAALFGCGADDIQMNGKIFDALGVNSTGSVKKEVVLRERSPLVVPPGLDKLPEPGAQGAEQTGIAEIRDHDAVRTGAQAELERQQVAYCKANYDPAKAQVDPLADSVAGPLGPCRQSILSAVDKWNKSED